MIRLILVLATMLLLSFCKQKEDKKNEETSEKPLVAAVSLGKPRLEESEPYSEKLRLEIPKGISFQVDDVQMADSLLLTDSAKKIFENKIGKEIAFLPKEHTHLALVSSMNNGLIQTVQECYDTHRPLVLTPDVIWLAICQGVSIHIYQNTKSLEKTIFVKNKPKEIWVRNDSLEYAATHWEGLIDSLSLKTKKYTKEDFYSFFVSEFTTTSKIDKTAYQITLLESYKDVFDYIGMTGCGIPSIHIAGEKEDWQTILKKLEMLDKIGLGEWAKNLKPVIAEFVNAADGKPNQAFWKDIYKNTAEYNAFYISGWIIKFFPYIKVEKAVDGIPDKITGEIKVVEVYKPNQFYEDDNYLLSTLSTDNFPTGIAEVPLTWNNYFKKITKKMKVYAGFFAIKQYPDKSLQPLISWAICEANAANIKHKSAGNSWGRIAPKSDYWTPHVATNVTDSAIYDSKSFKNQSSSLAFVKKVVLDSLEKKAMFKTAKYKNDSLQIQILSNGKVGNVSMLKSKNKALTNYVKSVLKGLPAPWFPALAHPKGAFEKSIIFDDIPIEDIDKIKIRVNSIVKIKL